MKKISLAIGIVILIVIGFFVVRGMFSTPAITTNPNQNNPFGSNTNSSNTGTSTGVSNSPVPSNGATMQVALRSGGSVVVSDFIHNGETAADIENSGRYFLAGSLGYCIANVGCPSGFASTDFQIIYTASDQSFHIGLLNEPLKNARLEAEQFLQTRLGISQAQMCNLYYYVETTAAISPIYDNKNLGFSFCPGAVQLP